MAAKKTKEWVEIVAPEKFGGMVIGRTLAEEKEKVLGRRVMVNAMDISDAVNKFYLKFFFRIIKLDGGKALTEFDGTDCMRDYLSRMVLRRVRRIDMIQDLRTKDGVKLRVKSLGVISRKAKKNVQLSVKKVIMELIKTAVENSPVEKFVEGLLTDEMKRQIVEAARKIYPMRNFEVRKIEVLKQAPEGKPSPAEASPLKPSPA